MSDLTDIYWEGQRARQRAEPESVCPYERGTPEATRWRQGWGLNAARQERNAPAHMREAWAHDHRERPR